MSTEDASGGHVIPPVVPAAHPGVVPPADPAVVPPVVPPADPAPDAVPASSGLAPSLASPPRSPGGWGASEVPVTGGQPGLSAGLPTLTPETTEKPRHRWIPIAIIAFLAALVIGAAVTVGILVSNQTSPGSRDTSEIGDSPGIDGWGDIESRLDAKIEQYKAARDDGSLWEQIPATPKNDTAVTAFLFFLTDMKIAASFGVDAATASRYAEEARVLEEKLLAEEPLGSDIEIAFSEDRIFRYDGETGEGGYFTE